MKPSRRGLLSATRVVQHLVRVHRPLADEVVRKVSSVVFAPLGFNQSPFYQRDCRLANRVGSYSGIDRCLRINEVIDATHSRVFHVAVISRSIAARDPHRQPIAMESHFAELQRDMLHQLFDLLESFGVHRRSLNATWFGGAELGGGGDSRDRKLNRRQKFPEDRVSAAALKRAGISATGIGTIANFDIAPFEGALVGPRVEVHHGKVELATAVFDYARVRRGRLDPINFVAGYGIGVERLFSVLGGSDFLNCVPRYRAAQVILEKHSRAARSPIMAKDVLQVLFGLEALAHLPIQLSGANEALVRQMKVEMKPSIHNLGLSFDQVTALFHWFRDRRTQGGDIPVL
jgi:hypothetical protein